ncbi:MAG: TonB-dependent receptor [Pseudomonadota bacterium]
MKQKLIALAVMGLPAIGHTADSERELDTIIVTATRTAQTADDSLQSVTVITRKEIEQSQARDLMGLLGEQAGINVARTGGEGKGTSVYLRGTYAKHVLVLVDGVRASAATTGEYDWNALSPEQIERIEIVRGPRASLYGSDAIGGVIQIFTRRATRPSVSVTVGSRGTRSVNAALGGGEAWHYSLEAGRDVTDGIPTYANGSKAYGFDRSHFNFGIDGNASQSLALAFKLAQSWGRSDLDPSTGDSDYKNRTASLKLAHQVNDGWQQTLTLGDTLDQYTSHSPYLPATIETMRRSLSWQHDVSLAGGLFSAGLDHWNDEASKDRSGTIDKRIENTGVFAQYQFTALASDWQLGARRDHHDVFGGQTTWNLSWGRDLGGGFRLTAGYGTAFKAPSVNDFFWPYSTSQDNYSFGGVFYSDTYVTQGNPNLRPETSRSAEIGLRYRGKGGVELAANAYETRIRNLIDWVYDILPGGGDGSAGNPYLTTYNWYPDNIGSARIRGLELTARVSWLAWDWQANYTRLHAENQETGLQLDRRAPSSVSLKAVRSLGPHRVRLEAEAYTQRMDSKGARTLDGYGLLHAGYEYAMGKDTLLGVRVENLLDHEYALARTYSRYYAAPGRSVFLNLRHQF